MEKLSYLKTVLLCVLFYPVALSAQTVLLYQNSFESPLSTPLANCGPDLDPTPVNTLWGGTGLGTGGGGTFDQVYTVETILIHGSDGQYTDLSGLGGNYCISMLSTIQDDRLALTLNSQKLPYANISFIMSPIDVAACGGPFGVDTAVMRLTVYDSPGGVFSFGSPGTVLDQDTVTGSAPGETPYTFNWSQCSASLGISSSEDGYITVEFDLLRSGYAAIDNISIESSTTPSSVSELRWNSKIKLTPNPVHDEIFVDGVEEQGELRVLDLTGRQMLRQDIISSPVSINCSELSPGIYIAVFRDMTSFATIKLVKE